MSTIRSHAGDIGVHGTPLVAICKAVALGFASHGFISWFLFIEPPVHGVYLGEVERARWQQACVFASLEIFCTVSVLHKLQCLNKFLWQGLIVESGGNTSKYVKANTEGACNERVTYRLPHVLTEASL